MAMLNKKQTTNELQRILKPQIQIVLVLYSLLSIIPLLLLNTRICRSLINMLFVVDDESYLTESMRS